MATGSAADGLSDCLGSIGRGIPVAEAGQAALRARLLGQLLKEKFNCPDCWLLDGDFMFEGWYERVCGGKSVGEELQL